MTFNGLFIYDGTEIINSERTERYLAEQQKPWFRPLPELDTQDNVICQIRNGIDSQYIGPDEDAAPWVDYSDPVSLQFLGAYPLDVSGFNASTRGSTPFENVDDGGTPGRIRHGIRTVVFSVALMATSQEGADYGFRWLKRALLGGQCSDRLTTSIATGLDLEYLSAKPVINPDLQHDATERGITLQRRLHNVGITNGPTEPEVRELSCGDVIWVTSFTALVGNPFELGYEQPILTAGPKPFEYAPGVSGTTTGPTVDTVEVSCSDTILDPIYDPNCPPYISPPSVPTVPLGCYVVPAFWTRYTATIPVEEVPRWGQVVPIIDIATSKVERGIRIRFYQDVDGDGDTADDPCNYDGDMLVSYIPINCTLRIDCVDEVVLLTEADGDVRRADSLVYGSDYKPFKWPSLTCGVPYVVAIDFDDTAVGGVPLGTRTRPIIALSLTPRAV